MKGKIMADIMSMTKKAILIPYIYDSIEGIMTYGEPFRKEVSVRYNRSNWVDIDMQPILNYLNYESDYIVTNQYYIFIID